MKVAAMSRPLALAALASCLLGGAVEARTVQLRHREQEQGAKGNLRADGFVRMLDFKHQLRVCNAYPYAAAVDVYREKERLTGETPMAYKSCRDFSAPMKAGDKLEFRVGDASAGTFSVSDLPNNDAVLLLVIHRHDTLSTAVAFESHVFASLDSAQVAVIDTYKGAARSTPKIMDATDLLAKQQANRSEELRYDSVVAVNPGVYEVVLDGQDGLEKARSKLVALKHESYVVLRTGVEAQQGPSYPQELVIFPNPDGAQLRSGSWGRTGSGTVALALPFILAAALSVAV